MALWVAAARRHAAAATAPRHRPEGRGKRRGGGFWSAAHFRTRYFACKPRHRGQLHHATDTSFTKQYMAAPAKKTRREKAAHLVVLPRLQRLVEAQHDWGRFHARGRNVQHLVDEGWRAGPAGGRGWARLRMSQQRRQSATSPPGEVMTNLKADALLHHAAYSQPAHRTQQARHLPPRPPPAVPPGCALGSAPRTPAHLQSSP